MANESVKERCINDLGNAVVRQAFQDYRALLVDYNILKAKMDEVEKFFTSKNFNLYSNLDGKKLLKQIIQVYGGEYAKEKC